MKTSVGHKPGRKLNRILCEGGLRQCFATWGGDPQRGRELFLESHRQARTQGGCRGCIPPTRPKEVLT